MPRRRAAAGSSVTGDETAPGAGGTVTERMRPLQRRLTPMAEFLRTEAGGGALLLFATIAALIWANSPWRDSYTDLWHTEIVVGPGRWAVREDLRHWVNDALMAAFFFLVGLEIKREMAAGELRDRRAAALPAIAALGGMVLPALVFVALARGDASRGWGIPMATDIAFAVGVLAVLGHRVPVGLKVFLLTLAIVDDIGAIVVIAVFYSGGVTVGWLTAAVASLGVVVGARRLGVARVVVYVPVGLLAWYCTYRAGIHPTIAAVALGLLTPAGSVHGRSVLTDLEDRLHPWTSYLVVPVFALANAGVPLGAATLREAAGSRLAWAVAAGLVLGKVAGIGGAAWVALRSGLGRLPVGVGLGHVVGAGGLGGIGFTVSLFVTGLAFQDAALQVQAKIGILAGSLTAAFVGVALLLRHRDPGLAASPETGTEGAR